MTIQNLSLPSEKRILDYLQAHPFSQDADALKISQAFAKTFADKKMPSSREIFETAQDPSIKNPCNIDQIALLTGITEALEDCSIVNHYQKLPKSGSEKIDLSALKQLRENWINDMRKTPNDPAANIAIAGFAILTVIYVATKYLKT